MTCNIIGLGDSAKHWNGSGFSVGCNDAFKWGHKLNHLIVINHPSKFSKEPERFKTIVESKPELFLSHTQAWRQWFPDMQHIRPSKLYGRLRKGTYYSAQTSPFVAMSHAFNLGAIDIILWGVDMVNHKVFHETSKKQKEEIDNYNRFIKSLSKNGVNVWIGAEGSALNLPIWKKDIT